MSGATQKRVFTAGPAGVGASAYQIWRTRPGNAGKTEDDFLASINGASAYDLWLAQGFSGSVADFLLSLSVAGGVSPRDLAGAIADTLTALAGKADRGRTAIGGAPYQVLPTDVLIAVTSLASGQPIALPSAASYPAGQVLIILDETGLCSSSLPITVTAIGSDTIAGQSSPPFLASPYGAMMLVSNTVNLWVSV